MNLMLMLAPLMLAASFPGPATSPAASTTPPAPAITALRLDPGERVRLDGTLDEPFWARADVATEFQQQEPQEGAPATERTEVRVAYDDQNLYIGVLLHDSDPAGVIGRALQRDAGLGSDDRFMWILDTFLDGRSGYFFEINPAGLMGDGLLRGTGGVNKSWDGIWEARVRRGDHGWSAEIRIPFRTLNFDPTRDEWGINFQRTVRRRGEESLWAGHRRNQGLSRPEHAGRLTGLQGMSQGLGLEVKPYAVAAWQQAPGRGQAGTVMPADYGMDATYSITPGLRASLTVNTDFAEAEVDQRRVNLTRFPLVFPERRDFFLEGSSVFSFATSSGPTPYFSRRIGLVGGQQVPITAGARLAGQAGPYDLGFLQVRTGAHEAGPLEDFTVARVRRNVLRSSMAGAVYTRRARPATDVLPAFDGHTVGVDLDLFNARFRGNRNVQFEAFAVLHNDPLGGDTTDIGDRSARGIRIAYPNEPFRAHVSLREFGTHYDPAVGFVQRRGFRRLQPTIGWSPRPSWGAVRQLDFQAYVEYLTDLGGYLETFNVQAKLLGVRFESGDGFELEARHDVERLRSDFQIHPGIVVPAGEHSSRRVEASVRSAGRRVLSGSGSISVGEFWSGTRVQSQLAGSMTPGPGVSVGASWERNDVSLPAGSFRTNLLRTSGGWQFSPWVSLNGSVQYDDVSRAIGTFARFRWTVRPGSDFFLVYTENLRERPLELDPRGGFQTIDRRAATKLTYTHRF
jgi:hypothetical protein